MKESIELVFLNGVQGNDYKLIYNKEGETLIIVGEKHHILYVFDTILADIKEGR